MTFQNAYKYASSKTSSVPVGNGSISIPLGWKGGWMTVNITGGPYDRFPGTAAGWFGVSVRSERMEGKHADLHLPIRDFQVPTDLGKTEDVVKSTLKAAIDGKKVYVGCMGGWGRTGLFLAIIAKAAGIDDPVAYVRKEYTSHAVETVEQQKFVDMFSTEALRGWLYGYAWQARIIKTLTFWK